MLTKTAPTSKPPMGILLLIALVVSMFAFSKIDNQIQESAVRSAVSQERVVDAETERRMVNMQNQINEVRNQVHKLHLIYGGDVPMCETLGNTEDYFRCHEIRMRHHQDAVREQRRELTRSSR